VNVTSKSGRVTTLVTAGRYQAGSIVVDPRSTQYSFALVQVHGQWRINDIFVKEAAQHVTKPADPSLLLLSKEDFEREYQSRNLYFYPASGDSSTALVPDPVYLPAQVGDQGIKSLVQTLLRPGLSQNDSWLFGAARTAFPPGTKLLSAQVVGGITAVVNVGGAATKASPSQQQAMAAQLYWSLAHKQPYPTQEANAISSIVLKINGKAVRSQSYNDWVPRAPDRPMYYQAQTSDGPGVAMLPAKSSQTAPVLLPKALADQPPTALAVSAESPGPAVVAGCSGKTIYLMPQSHAGRVVTANLHAPCRSLSWDERGNLWIATKMQVYVIWGVGSAPPAHPSVTGVLTPQLPPGKTGIQSLRVAPDGVRVAMLIGTRASNKIRIAAISKNRGPYTYVAQTSSVLRVGTDVADPISLTWLDPDHLLVLGRTTAGSNQLFEVPLNGGQSLPIATPRDAISVTANWPSGHAEPSVAVEIAPASGSLIGTIQMAKASWPSPDWRQVAKGNMPVFPG
jgi:two-component system sensor histidine kinase MtrB